MERIGLGDGEWIDQVRRSGWALVSNGALKAHRNYKNPREFKKPLITCNKEERGDSNAQMPELPPKPLAKRMPEMLSDAEVVVRVQGGESELFELLIRRHNMRLFRTIRSLLLDDAEAEDALQATYLKAWQALDSFAQRSQFITWITRIALREAAACGSKRQRNALLDLMPAKSGMLESHSCSAEYELENLEEVLVLERHIDALPESYRQVFVLCAVQEVAAEEVASCLGVSLSNVRVRLHRARNMLQERLGSAALAGRRPCRAWAFAGERCQRMVEAVMGRIGGPLR